MGRRPAGKPRRLRITYHRCGGMMHKHAGVRAWAADNDVELVSRQARFAR